MQARSSHLRSSLWTTLSGILALNALAPHAMANRVLSEERVKISASNAHHAGEVVAQNVHNMGHNIARVMLPKKRIEADWKGQVGLPAFRAIRPFHVRKRGYGFIEVMAAPTTSAFAPFSWNGDAQSNDESLLGSRVGLASGGRWRIKESAFLGMHFSADALPVLSAHTLLNHARIGLHLEGGCGKCLFQGGTQNTFQQIKNLRSFFSKNDDADSISQDTDLRIFTPLYGRFTCPILSSRHKFSLELGHSQESNRKEDPFPYGQALLHLNLGLAPILRKIFNCFALSLGGRFNYLNEGKLLSLKGVLDNFSFNPVISVDFNWKGSAKSAVNLSSPFALEYYNSVALTDRNFTGMQCNNWLWEARQSKFFTEVKDVFSHLKSRASKQMPKTDTSSTEDMKEK